MRRGFDERELEAVQRSYDTEFTLGATSLLVLFFGLVLVCCLCFVLGYSVGHRGSSDTAATGPQPVAGADEPASTSSSRAKPSATASVNVAPPPAQTVVNLPPSSDSGAASNPSAGARPAGPAADPAAGSGSNLAAGPSQWTVKPAMQAQPVQSGAPTVAGLKVQPATAPNLALMVQIAAVSHPEDADVLVSALRKRSYAVTVRRDLADSLIHVQIGPFNNAADAEAMRQKLLNDGYNAIVEP